MRRMRRTHEKTHENNENSGLWTRPLGDQSMEEVHEKDGGETSRKQPGELAHVVSQEHQRIEGFRKGRWPRVKQSRL